MKKFMLLITILPLAAFAQDKLPNNYLCIQSNTLLPVISTVELHADSVTPGEPVGTPALTNASNGCLDFQAGLKSDSTNMTAALTDSTEANRVNFDTSPNEITVANNNVVPSAANFSFVSNISLYDRNGTDVYVCDWVVMSQASLNNINYWMIVDNSPDIGAHQIACAKFDINNLKDGPIALVTMNVSATKQNNVFKIEVAEEIN